MNGKHIEFCVRCNKRPAAGFHPVCDCGGMIDVAYDLAGVVLHDSSNPLERYFDLLPLSDASRLPTERTEFTPCVHATKLGQVLGMPRLYLKDETVLPTRTTKYRMAVVALAYLAENGVREFCTSSTGNSSTAYAYMMPRAPQCRLYLFTAEEFLPRVQHADSDQVIHLALRGATFVEAFDCAKEYTLRHPVTAERGFFNPGRREGLKLAFLEATEQVPQPIDWYVQAVSSAMGVYGTFKGARELRELGKIPSLPRLLCVQQKSCNPMARAFADGSHVIRPEHVIEHPEGIASAILRGNPWGTYPYIREIVIESKGDITSVDESEIREAREMIETLEGLSPCFSASTALAGLARSVRSGRVPAADTVLVNLTGGDRSGPPPRNLRWMERREGSWVEI